VIHLDTSFLIRALVPRSSEDRLLRRWLAEHVVLGMSAVAWAEFLCGPVDERHIELASRVVPDRVPFGEEEAVVAAQLFNTTGRRRGSFVDSLIAATAIRAGARLATSNRSDFSRFVGAGLEFAEP